MAIDDVEKLLLQYISTQRRAATALSEIHGFTINPTDVQDALLNVLNLERSTDLLDQNLTPESIITLLRDYKFRVDQGPLIAEIKLDVSIIPLAAVQLLEEETIRHQGEIWRVHKNDADPWPSIPHAHNLESFLVLHLGTGEMFNPNNRKKVVGKIGKKQLNLLRDKLTKFELPPLESD